MKTTQYFDYTRKRLDSAQIKEGWIKAVIEKPEKTEGADGRPALPDAGACDHRTKGGAYRGCRPRDDRRVKDQSHMQ
jgi:hypothetical protein